MSKPTPTVRRGRTFAFPISRVAGDGVTPVDWPDGVMTSEIRTRKGGALVVTLTVDDADRAAANGGRIVLRLTDEESAAATAVGRFKCDVEIVLAGVEDTAVPSFVIQVEDVVTE